jgi:hypothetical protein
VVEFGWYLPPETQPMKRAQGVRISVKLSDGRVYNKNIPETTVSGTNGGWLNWFIPGANVTLSHGGNPFGDGWKVIDTVKFQQSE